MEAETLKHIEGLIAAKNAQLSGQVDIPAIILPDKSVVHSLEIYQDKPARFRGTFNTLYILDFIEYVRRNKTDQTVIFLDAEQMAAVAVFDLINPTDTFDIGWGDHRSVISKDRTPDYTALLAYNGKQLAQREFIDFIRDHRHCLEFFASYEDDDSDLGYSKVIQEVQRLEVSTGTKQIHEEAEFRRHRSAMEEVEIKSEGGLPAVMRMTCQPYPELPEQMYTCRMQAFSDGQTVKVGYRIDALEHENEQTRDTFASMILNDEAMREIPLYKGTFSSRNV